MKRPTLILVASLALTGAAHPGTLAGARDGDYQAADKDLVLVASSDDRVSLDGLDCLHPVVRGGRIVSKECWGNGHRDADLDAEWRVEGDVIIVRGKRYTRLPSQPAERATPASPGPEPQAATLVDPTGRPWRHNGSIVMVDVGTGVIAYVDPKASLRPVVQEGTVLFRGAIHPDRPVQGTAYAYKAGCPLSGPGHLFRPRHTHPPRRRARPARLRGRRLLGPQPACRPALHLPPRRLNRSITP